MSELYENLLNRYRNRSYWIDDYGIMGVILFNEDEFTIKKLWVKFKYSKLCLIESIDQETLGLNGKHFTYKKNTYKINIIDFVKYALTRGYDWKLFGKPEWEAIEPEKKKKFMKPKTYRK